MGTDNLINSQVLSFGLISQMSAVILLVILFALLRRHATRRPYFNAWTNAWIALAVALVAVTVRYNLLPDFLGRGSGADWWVKLMYFIYQFGKLTFLLLLLQGVLFYLKGVRHLGFMRWLWFSAGLVTLLSVVLSSSLRAVMFWQGFCNLAVYVFCAMILLTLPAPRRSLGTRFTGVLLVATAVSWLAYLLALLKTVAPQAQVYPGMQNLLDGPNNYLDLTLGMLLAFGMVLVLFEDTRREIDTAHQELRVAHEQLLRESYLDVLTGAYNRRAFNEGTGLEYAKGSFGVLVALDMDNLKEVNDRYGHIHGDALLRHFASVMRAGLRPSDKLYRMGGDEFLVVMPRATAKTAGPRIQEILATAPALKLEDSGVLLNLRASVGTAEFASVEDLEFALHEADRRMYAHKRASHVEPPLAAVVSKLASGN